MKTFAFLALSATVLLPSTRALAGSHGRGCNGGSSSSGSSQRSSKSTTPSRAGLAQSYTGQYVNGKYTYVPTGKWGTPVPGGHWVGDIYYGRLTNLR